MSMSINNVSGRPAPTLEFFKSPSLADIDVLAEGAPRTAFVDWSPPVDPAHARPLFKWLLLLNVVIRLQLGALPAALPEIGAAFGVDALRLGLVQTLSVAALVPAAPLARAALRRVESRVVVVGALGAHCALVLLMLAEVY